MNITALAFYLPQFYPIPENDKWWGAGFTEWTNVKKATPLFPGHQQPVEPGELGYYDLRNAEIRLRQAELAQGHGISGFCYWHYWFGNGYRLLDLPLREVVRTGEPDFPFCVGWANESWTGKWHGSPDTILVEQKYPGKQDVIDHFEYLRPCFLDDRYLKIDNKPFFLIYKPNEIPDLSRFTDLFQEMALECGFQGIHFVATNVPENWIKVHSEFAAVVPPYHNRIAWQNKRGYKKIRYKLSQMFDDSPKSSLNVYSYEQAMQYFLPEHESKNSIYPLIVPNWDNSPRIGEDATIFTGSTPKLFKRHVIEALNYVSKNKAENQIAMIKSWNEWAEGNYLEPDGRWGRAYLEVFKEAMRKVSGG